MCFKTSTSDSAYFIYMCDPSCGKNSESLVFHIEDGNNPSIRNLKSYVHTVHVCIDIMKLMAQGINTPSAKDPA